jgi:hypothetical protein
VYNNYTRCCLGRTPSSWLSTWFGRHKSSPNNMASKFEHIAKVGLQYNGNNDECKPFMESVSNGRR